MKTSILNGMTVPQLVERFTALALGQFKAELHGETGKYNRLFRELAAIEQELKARNGDQRIALVSLFEHPNAQVRLMAAQFTLAVARASACRTLQEIWDKNEFPQATFAMGTLRALERGDRKPT
ncbi:MAG: DUF2019 domain-containing protein [Pseudolabrys sp.]